MVTMVKNCVEHPLVNLVVAIILFSTGLVEGWDSLQEDLRALDLKAHHGVMGYGFFSMLKSIPDIVLGLEKMSEEKSAVE
jgi:hypothetical protein